MKTVTITVNERPYIKLFLGAEKEDKLKDNKSKMMRSIDKQTLTLGRES